MSAAAPRHAPRPRRLPVLLAALAVPVLLVACSGTPGASPKPSPSTPPSEAPTASPQPSQPATGAVIVTIRVTGEDYRVRLTEADDIAIARDLAAGKGGPKIPNGKVIVGSTDVNTGWSWHIDPADFEWVDMSIELCDGRPSFVENGEVDGGRFCPWSAEVVKVEPAA